MEWSGVEWSGVEWSESGVTNTPPQLVVQCLYTNHPAPCIQIHHPMYTISPAPSVQMCYPTHTCLNDSLTLNSAAGSNSHSC